MLLAALFAIAKKVEATQESTNREMGKQNVAYTCNSALKRKEILTLAATWMNLEGLMLSE